MGCNTLLHVNQCLIAETILRQSPASDGSASQLNIYNYKYSIVLSNKCSYNKSMQITCDQSKNEANLRKHGVALAAAAELEWDGALI